MAIRTTRPKKQSARARTHTAGKTPQGQIVAETPEVMGRGYGSYHSALDAYGGWLGDPGRRYGRLSASTDVPISVKLEMLRDPVIAWCQAFVGATLVKASRVIECTDEDKRLFFEAMFRKWEKDFVLQASLGIPLGAVGLIKKFEFAIPQPVEIDAPPVWTASTLPFICKGFDQTYPAGAAPRFDGSGHFDGIDCSVGRVDRFYSLWIPFARHMAFGNYRGYGRLENSYRPFWLGNFAADLFAVYLQKNADRIVEVGYPPGKNTTGVENQATALEIGDAARSGATVAMPTTVYSIPDTVTGEPKPTSVRKWTMEFLDGAKASGEFLQIFEHMDGRKSLGYFLPPQAFLHVGGGDLGGPTTADTLTQIAEELLLSEASELDFALNEWTFPIVSHANFPPDSPPVRVTTKGLSRDNRNLLSQIILALLTRPDIAPDTVNIEEVLKRLSLPKGGGAGSPVPVKPAPVKTAPVSPAPASQTPAETNPASGGTEQPATPAGEPPAPVGGQALAAGDPAVVNGQVKPKAKKPKPDQPTAEVIADIAHAALEPEGDSDYVAEGDIEIALRRLKQVMPEAFQGMSDESIQAGGPGSGNFGHAGRPGESGGSGPNTSIRSAPRSKKTTTVPNWQGQSPSEPASLPSGEGQARGMSEAVRAAIGSGVVDCFDYTKKKGLEAAVLIDGDGNRIGMAKSKSKWEVDYSDIADGTQRIDIHSHPNRSSFSEFDVQNFTFGTTDHSIVVGSDGTIYTMSKPRGWSRTQASGYNFKNSYSDKKITFTNEARRQGIYDPNDGFEFTTHKAVEAMCKDIGLIYSRIPPTGGA